MSEDLALDTVAQADATPQKSVKRWLLEIKLANKREKDWRKSANAILDVYRGRKRKRNSFNILWSNTEVLRPALYNSVPKPDVRRRFRQNDVLGKAVGEVMERSLTYCVDAYDLDNCLQNDVLDSLLPGRGLSRVRYVPKFKASSAPASSGPVANPKPAGGETPSAQGSDEAYEGDREEVEYEQALCEHVQWDDFLHGPGKTWEEVQWVAFRARLSKDDLIDKFGEEVANLIKLDEVDDSDLNENKNDDLKRVFKRAELWEIWDKEGDKVFFVSESYKTGLIYPKDSPEGEPPLKLKNFFPVPRPLQMVEDTGTLIPEPLYELYREQAAELDLISGRINKIVNACRVRFVHDSTLTELKELMGAGDNEGIPAESARSWMANGGLEKAIWWMPVEHIAVVLRELYVARDAAKVVIYEITGISDILRGVTDPNETLGAQQLKANSSSLRLQRMQHEVQRYTRDLIRLLAEVIGENFDPQTLAQMTGLQFATAQQKQVMQLQAQAAQQQQQPIPPQIEQALKMPTWDEIMGVLKSDMQREYRVDVETDSTVAQSLQQDMAGMREVLSGIVEFWQGAGPAVQAGAVKMDAVKAITLSIARRARMGLEVEDALETGMQQPTQQGDPAAEAKAQEAAAEAQKEQAIAQREAQEQEAEMQRKQIDAQEKAQLDAQQKSEDRARQEMEQRHKEQMDAQQKEYDRQIRAMELDKEDALARYKIDQDNATKLAVAEISASASMLTAASKPDAEGGSAEGGKPKANPVLDKFVTALLSHVTPLIDKQAESIDHITDYLSSPKTAERDATGRLVRLIPQMKTEGPLSRQRDVMRDTSGRPVTIQ